MAPVHDPIAQLAQLAGEIVALKDVLGEKVGGLRSWSYHEEGKKDEVRALVTLYERILSQCHRVLSDMARLDIDTRLVQINEAQADLLQRIVEAVLTSPKVGLDRETQTVARAVLAQELNHAAAT